MQAKKKKMIVGALIVVALVLLSSEEEGGTSNYWSDKMIPGLELRCLSQSIDSASSASARQDYCQCVAKTVKRTWKNDEFFRKQFVELVSEYINLEKKMKTAERNQSVRLVESELQPHYRDLYLRMGLKWAGPRFEKIQQRIQATFDPIYDRSMRTCLKF